MWPSQISNYNRMTMKVLEDGRVNCRVQIIGRFNGELFTYTDPEDQMSQYIWPDGDPSTFWWEEGNMACDCNRRRFLPEHLKAQVKEECGRRIDIISITPLEDNLPILVLEQ